MVVVIHVILSDVKCNVLHAYVRIQSYIHGFLIYSDDSEPELELIKVSNCQPFHLPGADVSASATVIISNMECNFKLDGHGFQLSAKQNTLPSGLDKCTLEISPSTSGDYQFPDTLKPVSAIYWIRCKPRGITFQQPILAQIQHCAKPGSSKHLYFCRATCYEKKPPYVFRKVDARVSFSDDDFCGTIELEHFCGVCIGGEESVDQLYTAILFDYYSSPSHYIHMVITKNEETHKTVSQYLSTRRGVYYTAHNPCRGGWSCSGVTI